MPFQSVDGSQFETWPNPLSPWAPADHIVDYTCWIQAFQLAHPERWGSQSDLQKFPGTLSGTPDHIAPTLRNQGISIGFITPEQVNFIAANYRDITEEVRAAWIQYEKEKRDRAVADWQKRHPLP